MGIFGNIFRNTTAQKGDSSQSTSIPTNEVFEAWTSSNLDRMLAVIDKPSHPVDRHYLLQNIVRESYRLRKTDPEMKILCEKIATQHISEFPVLAKALIEEDKTCGGDGTLPLVSTFQNLATLLTEDDKFDEAVQVCEEAKSYGLSDGTKSGFDGRIERIHKAQKQVQ